MTFIPKTIPKLRFPDFDGQWEETEMGEWMTFKNGYNASKEQYGSGRKFINVLDIIENNFITHDRIIGTVDIPQKDFEKNEVNYGHLLFQRSSETREEVGQTNVYLDKEQSATFGGFVIRGKPTKEFHPVYFNSLLKSSKARKDITSRSGGSTRYNIGQESLSAVLINVAPTLPEQRKIADFLTAVDGRIGQLIQKKALLEDYKKGVMQQLFTQALRFKDNDGNDFPDWEDKKLEDIFVFSTGKNIKQVEASPEFTTPCVRYGELYHMYGEIITTIVNRTNIDHSDLVFSDGDEILLPSAGEDPLDIGSASALTVRGVAIGRTINVLKPKSPEAYELRFASYYINQRLRKKISTLARGASISNVYNSDLRPLEIRLPSLPEQTKIANFLSALDRKIETVATQITETQTFKRGLLQQMFV